MKALFVANVCLGENEGIYKKIYAEACAISKNIGDCSLLIKNNKGTKLVDVGSNREEYRNESILDMATEIVKENKLKVVYVRLMVPSFKLIYMMRAATLSGCKVYYEIPTYPFFAEQFRASKKKYRAIVKIVLNIVLNPLVEKYCNRIVIIRSNSKIPLKKKMYEISNGVNTSQIRAKTYTSKSKNVFRMVAVGTFCYYHGYDRVLEGLYNCSEKVDDVSIELHLIGESDIHEKLKDQAKQLNLKKVYFHGIKNTEELNEMYENFDVGLGCLALHRRNADIDTTIKMVEYYCRGIPVVTSGKSQYNDDEVTISVPDVNEPIDISYIYNKYMEISKEKLSCLSENAKKQFDWNYILGKLFNDTL